MTSSTKVDLNAYRKLWTDFTTNKPEMLDVEKRSIESLKAYAQTRFNDLKKERDVQHQICMMHYWDGYINAISEILNMEDQ